MKFLPGEEFLPGWEPLVSNLGRDNIFSAFVTYMYSILDNSEQFYSTDNKKKILPVKWITKSTAKLSYIFWSCFSKLFCKLVSKLSFDSFNTFEILAVTVTFFWWNLTFNHSFLVNTSDFTTTFRDFIMKYCWHRFFNNFGFNFKISKTTISFNVDFHILTDLQQQYK